MRKSGRRSLTLPPSALISFSPHAVQIPFAVLQGSCAGDSLEGGLEVADIVISAQGCYLRYRVVTGDQQCLRITDPAPGNVFDHAITGRFFEAVRQP